MKKVDCLVVGGGNVAARKVKALVDAGASVLVVSPNVTPGLRQLCDEGAIQVYEEMYSPGHLQGRNLVIAATDRPDINAIVCRDAHDAGIFVNSAESPKQGTFTFGAVIRRGDFCLSISTGGANPMLAARLRLELEERFGPEYEMFMELLAEMRTYIISRTAPGEVRQTVMERLLDEEYDIRRLLKSKQVDKAREAAVTIVDKALGAHSPIGEE